MKTNRKFAVFILTHGRPDNVRTIQALTKTGYSGEYWIVIDDEDKRADEYFERYGNKVLQFNKKEVADTVDEADTSGDRRAILYARHASQRFAKDMGYTHLLQLDDDYADFRYRFVKKGRLTSYSIKNFDAVCEAALDFLDASNALTFAFGQGGDMIGGIGSPNYKAGIQRKAMNSFYIRTDRYCNFKGRVNEDVNFYVSEGAKGELIMSDYHINVLQMMTQKNAGGMTDLYQSEGTYAKSFYSVMMAPSSVKIYPMGTAHRRLHHKVDWRYAVPKILNAKYKKA